MKEKNTKKGNLMLMSLAMNAAVLFAEILIGGMSYETNDDFAIASRITAGYPYVGFVNYFLCRLLIPLAKALPSVNVFVIFTIALSFLSFTYITYLVFRASGNAGIRLVTAAVIIIFSFDHYCCLQFTKTASLAMTCGMLALADAVIYRRKARSYAAAIVFIYLGACVRVDALLGTAAFIIVFLFFMAVFNIDKVRENGYLRPQKLALYLLLVIIVCGAYGLDKLSCRINVSTDELRYAEDYSLYRSNIVDYPTYEYYDMNKDKYDAIGISENDIYLIDHWVFDYDGAASMENLKKIDSIERPSKSAKDKAVSGAGSCAEDIIKGIKKRNFTGIHIILLCALAVWAAVILKPKHMLYILCIGGAALSLYIAIYYMGRPTYRALYAADAGAAFWLIYYAAVNTKEGERDRLSLSASVIVLLVCVPLMIAACHGCEAARTTAQNKIMSEQTEAFFRENADSFYVWSAGEKKFARVYATPWRAPDDSDINVTGTGGWGVLSPYVLGRLGRYGIYNPIKDIIDNGSAYYIGSRQVERMEEYYNKWYGDGGRTVRLERAGDAGGEPVWRVVTKEEQQPE